MPIGREELVGLVVVASFAAGLNVYATAGTLGLLAHFGAIALPSSLDVLSSWPVIGAAAALFLVELVADKIPAFDLLWNALHTFIRVPIAALLSYAATAQLSPGTQIVAALAGGLIALIAHGGKTAVRAAVTPSPEPVSNFALSAGEDVLAVALTWFATQHPYIAAGIVAVLLLLLLLSLRLLWRALRRLLRGARREVEALQHRSLPRAS
jgi:hypothetical protein